jgi:hypothetical protein
MYYYTEVTNTCQGKSETILTFSYTSLETLIEVYYSSKFYSSTSSKVHLYISPSKQLPEKIRCATNDQPLFRLIR